MIIRELKWAFFGWLLWVAYWLIVTTLVTFDTNLPRGFVPLYGIALGITITRASVAFRTWRFAMQVKAAEAYLPKRAQHQYAEPSQRQTKLTDESEQV